jgi:ABC-type branched-subunit amino acid transport system ATPase component
MSELTPDAPVVLRVVSLSAGYGGPPIIDNVSLEVRKGKITAIVGPNGAGKSTLLKAISGVIKVSSGQVILLDKDCTNMAPEKLVRLKLAYVPQVANTFPDLTVRENLEMGGYIRRHGVSERINELCALFPDLRTSLKRKAGALSGGQRSMLAMARGLMLDPEVMLLDEPSAGLSPILQKALWEQIESVATTGVGVCVVEQNTRRSLRHADWAYVMVLGKNRLDGPAEKLLHDQEVIDLYVGRMS